MILKLLTSEDDAEHNLIFWCPGCKRYHPFRIKSKNDPIWNWNGDMEKPTFTPSLLCDASRSEKRCHLIVTDGKIHFCGDCHHELKGKTVPIPPFEEGDW
jgi:hypothetical protein